MDQPRKAPAHVMAELRALLIEERMTVAGQNLDNLALRVWLKMEELQTGVRLAYRHVCASQIDDDSAGNC
jgi:hypothetical protein